MMGKEALLQCLCCYLQPKNELGCHAVSNLGAVVSYSAGWAKDSIANRVRGLILMHMRGTPTVSPDSASVAVRLSLSLRRNSFN